MKLKPITADQRIKYRLKTFRGWLKEEMSIRKLTQADIGKILGISQQAAGKKLNDESPFSLEDVLTIFEEFGTPAEEIAYVFMGELR